MDVVYRVAQERACCAWNFPFFSLVIVLHATPFKKGGFPVLAEAERDGVLRYL